MIEPHLNPHHCNHYATRDNIAIEKNDQSMATDLRDGIALCVD